MLHPGEAPGDAGGMHSPLLDPDAGPNALPGAVLLDARTGADVYAAGHLRGALHADLEHHLSTASEPGTDPVRGGRHPLPPLERWRAQVGAWGIGPETPVVVYDDKSGANAAARAWWMLRALGHRAVWVLDGGLQAAMEAGWALSTEVPRPVALGAYPAQAWQLATVDSAAVDALRSQPHARVLDVRAGPRYRGEMEPLDPVAGHIPGAVNLPFTDNL